MSWNQTPARTRPRSVPLGLCSGGPFAFCSSLFFLGLRAMQHLGAAHADAPLHSPKTDTHGLSSSHLLGSMRGKGRSFRFSVGKVASNRPPTTKKARTHTAVTAARDRPNHCPFRTSRFRRARPPSYCCLTCRFFVCLDRLPDGSRRVATRRYAGGEAARVAPPPVPAAAADARVEVLEGARLLPAVPALRLGAGAASAHAVLRRQVSGVSVCPLPRPCPARPGVGCWPLPCFYSV